MEIKFDYESLKRAIQKNPQVVANETKMFLYRASKRLESKAGSSPWRVGGSGGGVPVDTGNLLRSHKVKYEPFRMTYYQDDTKADYGKYVHKGRPWLSWTRDNSIKDINNDAKTFLQNITTALAKK